MRNINGVLNETELAVLPPSALDWETDMGSASIDNAQPLQAQSGGILLPSTKTSIGSSVVPLGEKSRDNSVDTITTSVSYPPVRYKTFRTLLMSILVSMGGLVFGYGGVGQIGGFLTMRDYRRRFADVYEDGRGEYKFSNARAGTVVGILMIGAFIGSFVAAPITNRFGRRKSISLWCAVYVVGQIIEISTDYAWYQLAMGRLVEGLGIGGLSVLTPMYQSETAPKQIRGALISAYQLFITLGILLANLINLGTSNYNDSRSWRVTMIIALIWPTIMGAGMMFLPESPRWDYRHGNVDRAAQAMAKMYHVSVEHPQIAYELRHLQEAEEAEKARAPARWNELFTASTMLKRIVVGMALQAGQQLTGANYFFYYGTTLFASAGVGNSYVTAVIIATVNFLATFAGLWICERFGRRRALMSGAFEIATSLLIFASVGYTSLDHSSRVDAVTAGAVMVAFACFAIVGFATTWGPLPWVVCAEIYPQRYKASAMAVATGINWAFNFLIGFFTPFITNAIGYSLGYVFGFATLLMGLFVYFFVPETAGRSLEDIDHMILAGTRPRDSAKWQPPSDI